MSDAWHLAKIKRFEQVLAAPGITLLRVTARAPRRHGTPGERPVLLADDGHIVNRYQALPSPRDPKGVLRAAYSVPTDFVTPETVFSLLLDDGAVLSLPAPAPGAGRAVADRAAGLATELARAEADRVRATRGDLETPPDDLEPDADGSATGEPDRDEALVDPEPASDEPPADVSPTAPPERRSDIMSRVIELSAALAVAEREAREQREAREALETELAQRREQASAPSAAAAAQVEGAQRDQEAVEDQRATQAELADARQREAALREELRIAAQKAREEAEAEFAATRAELEAEAERATASLGTLERRVGGLELSLTEHGEQIVTLEAERDEAVRVRDELGREVISLRAECARLERELHDALDSVRRMAIERDELGRQAAAFDQVATRARERATEAEEAHQRSQSVLAELETWRAELERRLASMSSELGEARTRAGESDRRLAQMRGQLAEAEARAELVEAQLRAVREQSGAGDTTVIETAELERMSRELTALRSAGAQARHELEEASQARLREVAAERDELAARVGDLSARLQRAESASVATTAPTGAEEADAGGGGPAPLGQPGVPSGGDPVPTIDPAASPSVPPASRLMPEPDLSSRSAAEQAEIAALSRRAEANAEANATREITQALLRAR